MKEDLEKMREELEKMREEKEMLIKKAETKAESKKIKKEIFRLKNPGVNLLGKIAKGAFNIAGNIGDSVINVGKNVLTEKPKPKEHSKEHKEPIGKKKYYANKITALNDCKDGEKVYYDAKEELYYVLKKSTKPKEKTKQKHATVDDVMQNIEKEINKFHES